jgi:hypothetical protein
VQITSNAHSLHCQQAATVIITTVIVTADDDNVDVSGSQGGDKDAEDN